MAQPLFKLVLILLAINTLLYVGGVRVVGGDSANMLDNFIQEDKIIDGQVVVSSEFENVISTEFQRSGSDVLNFIDSIAAVGSFIKFIINIVFTPLGLFISAGMPLAITLMLGMPLMVGLLLAVAYFIRSGA